MSGRPTADIVADIRMIANHHGIPECREAADRLAELDAKLRVYRDGAELPPVWPLMEALDRQETINREINALLPEGATWEQLAATWRAVHLLVEYPAAPADDPANKIIRYLQSVKP